MTKTNQSFNMYQGEDKTIEVPIVDSDDAALTLTGATVDWKLFDSDDTELIAKQTGGSGITIINKNGTDDGIQITLADTDTDTITPGRYYHECRITDASSNEEVVFTGFLRLNESKTN